MNSLRVPLTAISLLLTFLVVYFGVINPYPKPTQSEEIRIAKFEKWFLYEDNSVHQNIIFSGYYIGEGDDMHDLKHINLVNPKIRCDARDEHISFSHNTLWIHKEDVQKISQRNR